MSIAAEGSAVENLRDRGQERNCRSLGKPEEFSNSSGLLGMTSVEGAEMSVGKEFARSARLRMAAAGCRLAFHQITFSYAL